MGYQLKFEAVSSDVSCEKIREFPTQLALLVSLKNESIQDWKPYLDKCKVFKTDEYDILFSIVGGDEKRKLDEVFEEREIPKERRQKIIKLLQNSGTSVHITNLWKEIEDFLALDIANLEKNNAYNLAQDFKLKLDKYPDGLFKKLSELILAISFENKTWAKSSLFDLLNFHPARIAFEVNRDDFREGWDRDRYEKLLIDIGLKVGAFFKKDYPLETDIFMTLMDDLLDSRKFSFVSSQYQIQWSLTRVRESFKQGRGHKLYPSFWYEQLSHRTSSKQIDVYLDSLFEKKEEKILAPDSLWIFTEVMPSEPEKRLKIKTTLLEHVEKSPYFKYVALELMENDAFKRVVASDDEFWKRSLFQLKRSVLRELFMKGVAKELMMFHLLDLGDHNRDYLWVLFGKDVKELI